MTGLEIMLGVFVSLIVTLIKKVAGTTEWKTLGLVALVSLIGAGAYCYLSQTAYWETLLQVVITAGAFYAYILERFK